MKVLFILLLAISQSCFAQNCDSLIVADEDKMTGKKSTRSKTPIIVTDDGGESGFSISVIKTEDGIILHFMLLGSGKCVDENADGIILFRDGSRAEIKNNGSFNCRGNYVIYFGGAFRNGDLLQNLSTKVVEAIRIFTVSSYVQKDLGRDNGLMLRNLMSCVIK